MNKQHLTNASDLQNLGSAQLLYLEIDPGLAEMPVQSQAIPLNMIINSQSEKYVVPVSPEKNEQDQVCVYVESIPTEENALSYTINGNKYTIHSEPSTSTPVTLATSPLSTTRNDHETVDHYRTIQNKTETKIFANRKNEKLQIKGFVHVLDRMVPPRAIAVLPPLLHFRKDVIAPRRSLPQRVRFGPAQGISRSISFSEAHAIAQNAAKINKPIFLVRNNDGVTLIDFSDKDKCNWLGLLPLGTASSANVWLYEEDNYLYGITVETITAGTPLALGYSRPYLLEHSLPEGQPVMDISEDLAQEPRQWWCHECERAFATISLRRRHVEKCHTENQDKPNQPHRKYRCRYCTRTFARLFTFRRHIAHYCPKKSKKPDNSNKTIPAEDVLNIQLNMEDNRLPSDESLQNYTNGLDFSTSLFDTDRIPGLDISGSSRSEIEFNSYGIPYRDENALTPDLSFDKLPSDSDKTQNTTSEAPEQPQTPSESLIISCAYCKLAILRHKKRQHLRECPEKRVACECGRTFANRAKLAQHAQAEHPPSVKTEPGKPNVLEYKCEKCEIEFKRRGMLVNHLWRVHRSRAAVPLELRVRHYPCALCSKVYGTATKRNRHQAIHHPDAVVSQGYAIEGGRRSVAPAACTACPRQYATRAKLLQHMRRNHPDLAPPLKQSSKTNSIRQNTTSKSVT